MDKLLERLRSLLQIKTDDHSIDGLITYYGEAMEQKIFEFCNISKIPDSHFFVWCNMTRDALIAEHPTIPQLAGVKSQVIKTKIGDTEVSPTITTTKPNAAKSSLDEIVLNYRMELVAIRRVRW